VTEDIVGAPPAWPEGVTAVRVDLPDAAGEAAEVYRDDMAHMPIPSQKPKGRRENGD